jgi:hypothetical protein
MACTTMAVDYNSPATSRDSHSRGQEVSATRHHARQQSIPAFYFCEETIFRAMVPAAFRNLGIPLAIANHSLLDSRSIVNFDE